MLNLHGLMLHRGEVKGLVGSQYQRRALARQLIAELRVQAKLMGLSIMEISCRGGEPEEEAYRHLGFHEYGRLPGGLVETWGEKRAYDHVLFWMPMS